MARPRDPPLCLNIPPNLSIHQSASPYSPALPTPVQQGFLPSFSVQNNASQTPLQPFPTADSLNRPTHHPNSPSVAHLAAAGIHPPFPMALVGGPHGPAHFSRPSLMLAPGQLPPFSHRRRQSSIGGPPKAVLGGPARKLSPIPPGIPISPTPPAKSKRMVVNLPKETVQDENGSTPIRQPWARSPTPSCLGKMEQPIEPVEPVELVTRQVYPPDVWRCMMPEVLDVFLPGKVHRYVFRCSRSDKLNFFFTRQAAWDEMKQQAIEEKLERLGVERGSGSNVPHIYAPHARAASVKSSLLRHVSIVSINIRIRSLTLPTPIFSSTSSTSFSSQQRVQL